MSVERSANHSAQFDADEWSDASARETLQLIVESVAQMVGFELAVISRIREGRIISVAVEGESDIIETLSRTRTPISSFEAELARAEDWGRFKFIDHRRTDLADVYGWVPDFVPEDEADAWHPLDALVAPLHAEDGQLLGILSIDVPLSRKRPDAPQLELLERYAAQAERALQNAFDREALAERLRLADAARRVVRFAVSQPDIETAIDECAPALLEGFRADDLTIRTYPDDVVGQGGTPPKPVTDEVRAALRNIAAACWDRQRVGVIQPGELDSSLLNERGYAQITAAMNHLGFVSTMLVPIGVGKKCLGHLILLRASAELRWTIDERASALQIARDIGHAVLASRNLVREQRLVTELRELDTYKSELLSTVSHELKNPLGALMGHLELAVDAPDLPEETRVSFAAVERAGTRISLLVQDLLTLALLEDPDSQVPASALDLRLPVEAALELCRLDAQRRLTAIEVDIPPGPLVALADADSVERVLINLLSNAVKYTPAGGHVGVALRYREVDVCRTSAPDGASAARELEIAVTDDGLGISPADQSQLFREFFRSTNPEALAQHGTGLGLTISARIVARLGGRITVESTLGEGSTFRVLLPVPGGDH